ncbi:NAD-dependent epimerase/dehydratase family protein [Tenacibaculum sp. SG-28]|uniref:NAD-dependent epimerase/dehydratase family protein n=1 Tax=Tenacibaculum sp. SG-28 TaxID=754426 RepID=UPI000CF4388E|nr:NAD-dependent epimerase/dehydratase family protein [Tenacibaculum sp. SG-28]PQJ21713.1 NAD-dependent epimerase [Tenacibaculum sp. SG-28]
MILVTGGTGLVGAHLLYHLAKENDAIVAIYRTKNRLEKTANVFAYYTENFTALFNKIQWVQADITDIPSLELVFSFPIIQVYHCAALVSFNPDDYKQMRSVNICGTANIVNFCIHNSVKKLCFVSSIAAVGDAVEDKIITEENEWSDTDDNHGYAITKYGAEMEVWRASQEGIPVVIVNPGVILGSGFWEEGSGKLVRQVDKGLRFYTEGVTGFVSVKDVVKAMILLAESSVKNQRFILVSENLSFREVFSIIAEALGKQKPSIKIGSFVTSVFWRFDWVVSKLMNRQPILTKNSAKSVHNVNRYSSRKITEEINFIFTPVTKAIQEVCENYYL